MTSSEVRAYDSPQRDPSLPGVPIRIDAQDTTNTSELDRPQIPRSLQATRQDDSGEVVESSAPTPPQTPQTLQAQPSS